MGILRQIGSAIHYTAYGERAVITPYGPNRVRFRSTANGAVSEEKWTLLEPLPAEVTIEVTDEKAVMTNGLLRFEMKADGTVTYYKNNGASKILLQEKYLDSREKMAQVRQARMYRHRGGGMYQTDLFFKPQEEKLYGLGQNPHGCFELKGTTHELFHKNTHITIPFLLSSRGYGFVWNNPGIGRCETVRNHTLWHAEACYQIDYIVMAGETPGEIVKQLSDITGKAPEFPAWASGFWQSKLRYQTQDEVMHVVREYRKRKLPLSVIVIDYFHWTQKGDWKFDPKLWPDPAKMARECAEMGVKIFVSVWPTVYFGG
ncbi:MAG: glycoside hydrolase family 31 protein, partial [Clostridia bacterium]|nr:glycoside hydrolase family 31 protein [Clostridia bacterium]